MKHAYVFPGQGAQAVGMGKDLYDNVPEAKALFEQANEILGFRITDIMFAGTDEELKQTKVTQPAVFLHSVIMAKALGVKPDAVAGHSLGEFSALVVAGALSFEDGLRLVSKRAMAMQKACEATPSTMAAVLALPDEKVEEICASIEGEVVVCANYNCPGQIVITGAADAVGEAGDACKEAGAKRVVPLKVSGPFHSALLAEAGKKLGEALEDVTIQPITIPYLTNVTADYVKDPADVKDYLVRQVSSSVRWQQTIERLIADGAEEFVEIGPGRSLSGFMRKINRDVTTCNIDKMEDFNKYVNR